MTITPSSVRLHRSGLLMLAVAALWSLLFDDLVVGAHRHVAPTLVSARIQTSATSLDEPCALCAATATLDALLLPIAPGWRLPVAAAIVVPFARRPSPVPRRRAHDWHSRAPPGSSSPR